MSIGGGTFFSLSDSPWRVFCSWGYRLIEGRCTGRSKFRSMIVQWPRRGTKGTGEETSLGRLVLLPGGKVDDSRFELRPVFWETFLLLGYRLFAHSYLLPHFRVGSVFTAEIPRSLSSIERISSSQCIRSLSFCPRPL